ncbi:MAG: YkvA family protein [Prolixibacteraceae bacterium]
MNKNDYTTYYTDESFRRKVRRVAKTAGSKVVYAALLLFYMMKDPQVPIKAKVAIMAALGYFILPADAVPDLLPLMGFSDDLGVLLFAISRIRAHLTPETIQRAREKIHMWFTEIDESELVKLHGGVN